MSTRHVVLCYKLVASLLAVWIGLPLLHGLVAFDWNGAGCCDAAVDWKAAKLALEGLSPYEPPGSLRVGPAGRGFGHPPTAPFWFIPFAAFSHAQLGLALAVVALALLAAHVFLCVKELDFPAPVATSALLFAFLWSLSGVRLHLTVIQTSIPIAACCAFSWLWLRRGRDTLGGVALGLACTLKLFPGLLVLFLLMRRRFRAAAAAAVAWSAVAGVMVWRFGWRAWPQFFEQQEPIAKAWIGNTRNVSLHGVIRRAFAGPCGPPELSEATLRILTTAAALALIAATFLFITWRRRRSAPFEFDLSWALLSAVATFANPWIWEHYITMLVLPALLAGRHLAALLHQTWRTWVEGAALRPQGSLRALIAVAGLALLALAVSFQTQEWRARPLLVESICGKGLAPAVHAWSERQLSILENTHWLTWVLVIGLVVLVGVLFSRAIPDVEASARKGET